MAKTANNVEELFGTLQQSVVEGWRKHLKTSKYSSHMALNDFYDEMPDLVDQLIEDYMGVKGEKVDDYKCIFTAEDMDVYEYLKALRALVKDGTSKFLSDSELKSDVDSILSLIDSTLYKLKELSENKVNTKMSLKNFLLESMQDTSINESYDEDMDMFKGLEYLGKRTRSLNPKAINKYIPANEMKPWMGVFIAIYVHKLLDCAYTAFIDEYEFEEDNFFKEQWPNILPLSEFDLDEARGYTKHKFDDVSDDEIIEAIKKWLPYIYEKINGSDIEIPY